MKLETIKISKKQAEREYKNYREVLKNRSEKYLQEMYNCFLQLKRGRRLIDIIEVMIKVGLNDKEEPRISIANCSWEEVLFVKNNGGEGMFRENVNNYKNQEQIVLPQKTFKEWALWTEEERKKLNIATWVNIKHHLLKTKVPIVPAQFLPRGKLNNYYILWEVDKWEEVVPPRRDPILLKRLSKNLFSVLAVWKMTKLEQSIIRGR